jgi:antitoxin HicB
MSTPRSFPVVLIPQPEGGYFVQCPTLPGCYSQGETVEECLANIREAIELVVEDMTANGQTIPATGPAIITEVTFAA